MISYDIKRGSSIIYSGFVPGQRREAMMGIDELTITFTLKHYVEFLKGDTVVFDGDLFILSKPSDFEKEGNWTYTLPFLSENYKLGDAQMLAYDEDNELTEYDCFFTGTADAAVDLILANANRQGSGWSKGTIDSTDTKDFDFSGDNCLTALAKIAKELEIEFWIKNKVIHLTKLGVDSGLSFRRGKGLGLTKLTRRVLDNKPVTILWVYGSKQNLPASYPGMSKRLRMPDGQLYISDPAKVAAYGPVEDTLILDEIFPKRTGTVTSITNALTFSDTSINFDINDHLVPSVSAKVKFISGQLSGWQFDIKDGGYDHSTKTITLNVNKDEKSIQVPSETGLKPAVGDEYIFIDVIMPQVDIDDAEIELLAKATEKYNISVDPRVQFEAPTDRRYLRDENIHLKLGDYVTIEEPEADIDNSVRIISKVTNIQDPFDVTLQLSDTVAVSDYVAALIDQTVIQKAVKNNRLSDVVRQRLMWRSTTELATMLDTLRAEMLLIMIEGGAYSTDIASETSKTAFSVTAGTLQHQEYTANGGTWNVSAFSGSLPLNIPYYAYVKASKSGTSATIVLSATEIGVEEVAGYYHFPYGIISSIIEDTRVFNTTKGYTRITGDNIKTGQIEGGGLVINLDTGTASGKFTFEAGSSGYNNLSDKPDLSVFATEDFVAAIKDDLQGQIDGSITTWFLSGVPTLVNAPASDWTTTALKNAHLGDLYYDNVTGYAYRFMLSGSVYSWIKITDNDVILALQTANAAQDTADGKRRVFVTQPVTPYDIGDLWAQGAGGDLMRAATARLTGAFVSGDWVKASKYTDDTVANQAITNAYNALQAANAAQGDANTANSAYNALTTALKDLAYKDIVELAEMGTTVIVGGMLKNTLIDAAYVRANIVQTSLLNADNVTAGKLSSVNGLNYFDLTNNKFKVGSATNWLDWNVTTPNVLTVKGHIIADSGTIGNVTINAGDLFSLSGSKVQIDPAAGIATQGYLRIPTVAPAVLVPGSMWAIDATGTGSDPEVYTTLASLTDVAIGSQSGGQALVWDATASKWKPGTVSAGSVDLSNYYTKAQGDARYPLSSALGSNAYTSTAFWHNEYIKSGGSGTGDANTIHPNGGYAFSYSAQTWLSNNAFNEYGGLITFTSTGRGALQIQYGLGHNSEGQSRIAFRTEYGTSGGSWRNWKEIWHTGNFTPANYPLNNGVGAAGTWGISITGNAASAAVLQTARTIQGVSFNGGSNINIINGSGLVKAIGTSLSYVADNSDNWNTAYSWGDPVGRFVALGNTLGVMGAQLGSSTSIDSLANVSAYVGTASGAPANGHLFSMRVSSDYGAQIHAQSTSSETWRFRRVVGGVWQPWVIMWHTGNLNPANYLPLTGGDITGNLSVTGNFYGSNYGSGLVGVYSATRYQAVFSMGDAYKLAAAGTSLSGHYGLAWSHSNMAGQTKAGLAHQLLVTNNGVTQTAIGTGIWTNGTVTAPTVEVSQRLKIPTSAPASPQPGDMWMIAV